MSPVEKTSYILSKNISINVVVRRFGQTLKQSFYSNMWHNQKKIFIYSVDAIFFCSSNYYLHVQPQPMNFQDIQNIHVINLDSGTFCSNIEKCLFTS